MANVDVDTDKLYWAFGGRKIDKRTREFKALKKYGFMKNNVSIPRWFTGCYHKAFWYTSMNTREYLLNQGNGN